MSNVFDKFLNLMRMNDDDDYDDDYDDFDDDDIDNDFEEEDDFDDIPAPVVKKKTSKKETVSREKVGVRRENRTAAPKQAKTKSTPSAYRAPASSGSKIVPMKSSAPKARGEVCVLRPTVFEDSREISDVLLSGRAAVVNLEGIDLEIAQRIIDFISGSCYAMAGNIEKISNYIFIVTPESIEISGDLQEVISSGIRIPSFKNEF